MIDTGKYEGHTPAPWELSPDDWVWAEHLFMQGNTTNFGNGMLITDAPLLLEEVKQLRESNERWQTHWEFIRSSWLAHIADGHISGNHVVEVMDALRPRDEEE
jgi:hypothetical protein